MSYKVLGAPRYMQGSTLFTVLHAGWRHTTALNPQRLAAHLQISEKIEVGNVLSLTIVYLELPWNVVQTSQLAEKESCAGRC